MSKDARIGTKYGDAYNWLWRAYEQKGMYDQAVDVYLKTGPIIQRGPEVVTALRGAYARRVGRGFGGRCLSLIGSGRTEEVI